MTFEDFILSLKLRHFAPHEFLIGLDRGNTVSPPELWHNIALTACLADEVRGLFGQPATITSAYRDASYNRGVGGVMLSQHTAHTALDIKVKDVEPIRVRDYLACWRGLMLYVPIPINRVPLIVDAGAIPFKELDYEKRGEGCLMHIAGGLGLYKTFVHFDTRGTNHSWSG